MFRNALPAEKTSAPRTAGHCFPKHVIETTLVKDVGHNFSILYTEYRSRVLKYS